MTVTLCDAGPLLAIIDPHQGSDHVRCAQQIKELRGILVTTWPCVTEAMHLADKVGGQSMQRGLWRLLSSNCVEIELLTKEDGHRMDALMHRYSNVPMDWADASLCVTAEKRSVRRIFTLDSDFRIYRLVDGGFFEIIPA